MYLFIFIILLFVLFVIITFAFPALSPIPYFPTNKKDLAKIIQIMKLENNHIVYDLGAGDGAVIFAAASEAYSKRLMTKFVAIDINPILVFILHLKRLFHPNRKNILIQWKNMFHSNVILASDELRSASRIPTRFWTSPPNRRTSQNDDSTTQSYSHITIYVYISPWLLEKTVNHIKKQVNNFTLISYMYPLPDIKPEKVIEGKKKIYEYKI